MAKRRWRRFSAEEKARGLGVGEGGAIGRFHRSRAGPAEGIVRLRDQPARGRSSTLATVGASAVVVEREEISRGLVGSESMRAIAARLGRDPSTISGEVAANGGVQRYRAWAAERTACRRDRRPKAEKLAARARLRAEVEAKLALRSSLQHIEAWLKTDLSRQPEMHVSHETIYQSLFVQGGGALRQKLTACCTAAEPCAGLAAASRPGGTYPTWSPFSERPREVEDRAVPGHWEGDLIIGKANRSAVGTLSSAPPGS